MNRNLHMAVALLPLTLCAMPLPDAVFYGKALRDAQQLTVAEAAEITAWSGGRQLGSYALGDNQDAGDDYVLVIRLDTDPTTDGARVGDTLHFQIDGEATGASLTLREPGVCRNQLLNVGENTIRAPVFSPPAGTYADTGPIEVSIASATPDVVIFYTLDGSEPTDDRASILYTDPIPLAVDTTVRARAFPAAGGLRPSPVAEATYLFRDPDSDGDNLPDQWESRIVRAKAYDAIANVNRVFGADDFDGDGLSNQREYDLGTDPITPDRRLLWFDDHHDTDGDGLTENLTAFAILAEQAGLTPVERDVEITNDELEDFAVLVLYDYETPFTENEIAAVQAFHGAGGDVLVLGASIDATDAGESLRALLAPYNVSTATDATAEPLNVLADHVVNRGVTVPLETGGSFVALTGPGGTLLAAYDDGLRAQLPGAVALQNDSAGRAVVAGTSAIARDDTIDGNAATFLRNCLQWLAADRFSLSLGTGWNLFSVPVWPEEPTVDRLFSDVRIMGDVWGWDGGSYARTGQVRPTTAYWAYVVADSRDSELRQVVWGRGIDDDVDVPVEPGWNAIGPLTESRIRGVRRLVLGPFRYWDPAEKEYEAAREWESLKPGLGYLFNASRAGTVRLKAAD